MHSRVVGDGRPLIILHGFLGTSDNWLQLAKRWSAEGYEVHLTDLRNHGRSFWDDEFNLEVLKEDLQHYIDYYRLEHPHILGHSLGGKIAMFDAMENPSNRGKYIVADISPRYYPPHHQYIFDAVKKIDPAGLTSRREAQEILEKEIPDPFLAGFLLKSLKRTPEGFRWSHNWEVLEAHAPEIGEALPPMTVYEGPVLFLKGERSPYISEEDIPLIYAHFPRAVIREIPGAGHLLHIDRPDAVYAAVTEFLKENE